MTNVDCSSTKVIAFQRANGRSDRGDMAEIKQRGMSGADVVVKTLEARGITHVFGVPGAKIDKVFNTLVDSSISTVVCRHEQNAAFIAGGIGRMTGRAGVAIATSGPGVANLTTGLATAHSEGDPMIALGGAAAVADRLRPVHQTLDSVELMKPVTKYAAEVDSPSATAEVLTAAFRAAESGRPGSAFVSLPMDIMVGDAQCSPIPPGRFNQQGGAAKTSMDEAVRLIRAAKSPVILLGLMASREDVAGALGRLLECTKLPVVGTFQAAGAVSNAHVSLYGGRVGQIANQPADKLLDWADLVLTIGYDEVEYWPTMWNEGKDRPIVHVDVVPATIQGSYQPAVELIGDIRTILMSLGTMVGQRGLNPASSALLQGIAQDRDAYLRRAATLNGSPIHPLRIICELQDLLSTDMTICSDMGSFSIYLSRYLHSFRARQLLISNGQQTLGVALPWGIAATLVRPTEKVLSISGDGGFLFSANELETAVRLKSNLVHMVWIDGTYNMVAVQERLKYGRTSGTDFGPVDYLKYAEACGAKGLNISRADEIGSILRSAFDMQGPVVISVNVDYSENASQFEHLRHDAIQ